MIVDDDQDSIWLRVEVAGNASCHVGYRSCFYREIPVGLEAQEQKPLELKFLNQARCSIQRKFMVTHLTLLGFEQLNPGYGLHEL